MSRHERRKFRNAWPVGILFVPLFGLVGVVEIGRNGGEDAMTHHWWWGMPFVGPLGMLLGLLTAVAFVVWFAHWLTGGGGRRSDGAGAQTLREEDRALAILRERFARGEIEEEEYLRRLRVLRRDAGGAAD